MTSIILFVKPIDRYGQCKNYFKNVIHLDYMTNGMYAAYT